MKSKQQWPISKQEIRFKRSLFRFCFAFTLVLVAGLITRISLKSFADKANLEEKIKKVSGLQFQIENPEIRFRSGIVPVIGLGANRIEWSETSCPLRSLTAQNILLRLDPMNLLWGELKAGRLDVDFIKASYSERCPEIDQPNPNLVTSKVVDKGKPSTSSPLRKLPSEPLQKAFQDVEMLLAHRPIKKVSVDKIKLLYLKSINEPIQAEGSLFVELGDQLKLNLKLKEVSYAKKSLSFLSSRLNAAVDGEHLSVDLLSKVREGKVVATLAVKSQEGMPTSLSISADKIPVSALTDGLLEGREIRYLWLSCQLNGEMPWEELQTQYLKSQDCHIDGPYGELVVSELQASLSRLDSLVMDVNKIQLDKIIDNKRDVYLSGVFSEYGVFSARLAYTRGEWDLKGHLIDSSFIFSNNNLRDIQKIKKIPFRLTGNKDKGSFVVKDVEVEDGQFEGEMVVQLNEDELEGRVAVHRLRFNPQVYKLMIQSQPSDLRVYGKFTADSKGIHDWSAMVGAPHLRSEFYEFNNLKVKGQGDRTAGAALKVTVGDGTLNKLGPLFDWLAPTLLKEDWSFEKVEFKELSTRLEVAKDRSLLWRRGYISLNNGWQLSSEGQRDTNRKVSAWLQWDRPDRRFLRWNYTGNFFKGDWVPQTPWVKSWLLANPQFLKKYTNILLSSETEDKKL